MPKPASLANLKPAWTPEDAAAAARRGWEKRRANPKPKLPEVVPPNTSPEAIQAQPEEQADRYKLANLARVRKQLDRLHRMLSSEEEPAKIDRLVAAIGRLHEIERQCAGWSLPPTLRANDKRGSNRRPGGAPMPQPVAPSVPSPVKPDSPASTP